MTSVVAPTQVLKRLKDDGIFDNLRHRIMAELKRNEDLKQYTATLVEKSLANADVATKKKRDLFFALRKELEAPVLERASSAAWELIISSQGVGAEIRSKVEEVYAELQAEQPQQSNQQAAIPLDQQTPPGQPPTIGTVPPGSMGYMGEAAGVCGGAMPMGPGVGMGAIPSCPPELGYGQAPIFGGPVRSGPGVVPGGGGPWGGQAMRFTSPGPGGAGLGPAQGMPGASPASMGFGGEPNGPEGPMAAGWQDWRGEPGMAEDYIQRPPPQQGFGPPGFMGHQGMQGQGFGPQGFGPQQFPRQMPPSNSPYGQDQFPPRGGSTPDHYGGQGGEQDAMRRTGGDRGGGNWMGGGRGGNWSGGPRGRGVGGRGGRGSRGPHRGGGSWQGPGQEQWAGKREMYETGEDGPPKKFPMFQPQSSRPHDRYSGR